MFNLITLLVSSGALSSIATASPLPGGTADVTPRQSPIWRVSFWSGDACSGDGSGSFEGPDVEPPIDTQNCRPIPEIGFTQAVTYYGDFDYEFRIHRDENCGDSQEFYIGNQDNPLCIPLSEVPGAIAWSVQVQA
ncbi:hypothetical protein MBLNU13_g09449t1 [Cladosporium sp. NU13]